MSDYHNIVLILPSVIPNDYFWPSGKLAHDTRHHAVFCPGFQKGRVPSQKGTFSAVNGLSKGHFCAVNGLSKGHFSAVNGPSKGHFSAVKGRIGALLVAIPLAAALRVICRQYRGLCSRGITLLVFLLLLKNHASCYSCVSDM